MKELLLYIARNLVEHPDQVTVESFEQMRKLIKQFSGPGAAKKMKRMGGFGGFRGF